MPAPRQFSAFLRASVAVAFLAFLSSARAETILQYFNTSWKEIERRVPELAEAGYTSLWLPPPAKASAGTYSVGYDPLDRFDLGDKDQSGSIATRYGTKGDLLRLIEVAHRFGLRIYFDNVMAHNAGPLDDV
ncbi:MAG TPA: alpha-amylase family glycosyl hydrolase, partial [Chthoniobacteraceae bacterium]